MTSRHLFHEWLRREPWRRSIARVLILTAGSIILFSDAGTPLALFLGLIMALVFENPFNTQLYTHRLLASAVVGLGAGMDLNTVAGVGVQGMGYTVLGLLFVFFLGWIFRKMLGVDREIGMLVTVGTAICGGSAIAALASAIRAKPNSVTVALATVFIFNAVALFVFPPIGHFFELSQRAFGMWSALAIHDTSSVVGATLAYGKRAAEVGIPIKLTRALWIGPIIAVVHGMGFNQATGQTTPSNRPWFILGFLIMAAIVTWIPMTRPIGDMIALFSKRLLVLSLFLIGLGLSKASLKQIGIRPFAMGFFIWIITAAVTLTTIRLGWII